MIQTTRGPMEESAMEITLGVIDDAEQFVIYRDLRVPGSTETYRQALGGFVKVNPFVAPRGVITVDLGDGAGIEHMEEGDLDKTTGEVDTEREYSCWVECRLRGTDKIVHRSAHVNLKTVAEGAISAVGSFG